MHEMRKGGVLLVRTVETFHLVSDTQNRVIASHAVPHKYGILQEVSSLCRK